MELRIYVFAPSRMVKHLFESGKMLTALLETVLGFMHAKGLKTRPLFHELNRKSRVVTISCNVKWDRNGMENSRTEYWVVLWGTQSNRMRLLVLQMTVNEMLKNPQHLWHFLDLLKSLKTPRKRFLAVEKDNHCRRTLLTFSLDFFLWTEQNLIQFFAAEYMIDPIWGRGGRVSRSNQADHGYVSQSFLQLMISMLFVACSQSQAQVRAGSKRKSLH